MKAPHACPLDSPSPKTSGNRRLHEQLPRHDNSRPAGAPVNIPPHEDGIRRTRKGQKPADDVFGLAKWLANRENR